MMTSEVFTPEHFRNNSEEKVWFLKTFGERGSGPDKEIVYQTSYGRDTFSGYKVEYFDKDRYIGPVDNIKVTPSEMLGALTSQRKFELLSWVIATAPQQMVDAGADPNLTWKKEHYLDPKPVPPLVVAIKKSDWEAASFLVKLGAKVNHPLVSLALRLRKDNKDEGKKDLWRMYLKIHSIISSLVAGVQGKRYFPYLSSSQQKLLIGR